MQSFSYMITLWWIDALMKPVSQRSEGLNIYQLDSTKKRVCVHTLVCCWLGGNYLGPRVIPVISLLRAWYWCTNIVWQCQNPARFHESIMTIWHTVNYIFKLEKCYLCYLFYIYHIFLLCLSSIVDNMDNQNPFHIQVCNHWDDVRCVWIRICKCKSQFLYPQ